MKLVVGLGNPGREYQQTRHNVGFEAVDALAHRLGWCSTGQFDAQARQNHRGMALDGLVDLPTGPEKLVLLKPLTFMNLSGQAVAEAANFYKLQLSQILVILDDLALPSGKLRLRAGGSNGGHNGLRDIARALGAETYPRLRIGIDPPPQYIPQKDYVLGRFTPEQRKAIDLALPRAVDCVLYWMERGIEPAMSRFNAE